MRVYGESFAGKAPVFVAAVFEWQGSDLPVVASVGRAEDRAGAGPVVGVGAGGDVDLVGVGGVDRDALDAGVVPVGRAEFVGDGDPDLRFVVPAVRAADVGA